MYWLFNADSDSVTVIRQNAYPIVVTHVTPKWLEARCVNCGYLGTRPWTNGGSFGRVIRSAIVREHSC